MEFVILIFGFAFLLLLGVLILFIRPVLGRSVVKFTQREDHPLRVLARTEGDPKLTIEFIAELFSKLGFSEVLIYLLDRSGTRLLPFTISGVTDVDLEAGIDLTSDADHIIAKTFHDQHGHRVTASRHGVGVGSGELPLPFVTIPIVKKGKGFHHALTRYFNRDPLGALGVIVLSAPAITEAQEEALVELAASLAFLLELEYLVESFEERGRELNQRVYEIAILKELGERFGYSLNAAEIADIIVASLPQLISYTTAASMIIDGPRIIFRIYLATPVSHAFLDTVKERMLASLTALTNQDFSQYAVEERITGTIIDESNVNAVQSFFNIPLVINDRVVGVLNVASREAGHYQKDEVTILYTITAQASRSVSHLERVLAAEQAKLNAMVVSMSDGVALIDAENRLLVINPAFLTILSIQKEAEDVTIFDLIQAFEGRFDLRPKLAESIRLDKRIEVAELTLGERTVSLVLSPAHDRIQGVLGVVINMHDLTREKELERLREDFSSMMVHELRSPLDGIRKLAEVLATPAVNQDRAKSQELSRMIERSARDMLEIVSDLLDVTKLETGRFSVVKADASLSGLLNHEVEYHRPLASERNLTILVRVDPKLPVVGKFDEFRIRQVMTNLLSNAIKYGGTEREIVVRVAMHRQGSDPNDEMRLTDPSWLPLPELYPFRQLSDAAMVSVSDSGQGIPTEQLPKLFSKFYQLQSGGPAPKRGSGLGLVIAKGIVEAHGGILGVSSKEGAGSTFFFTIPV
ncbi:MAG: hypothetical protein HY459_04685 [Parcubacteria group bacterium]|nr:hypothetical protein [Parcubacteria group bacterium]